MKYTLNKTNHVDFKTLEIGRLAPRAYAIPFATRAAAENADWRKERYTSDLVTVLSGAWEFKYYPKKSKLPATLDTARQKFDTVQVPCTWQRTGYENPAYINCPYGFDARAFGQPKGSGVKPPELPEDFPCAVYRKMFRLKKPAGRYVITFLGVAPGLDLYCNGKFVGYGEGTHNSYEFDLTDYLTDGENELVAVVFKWCTGSYLEAQDMFRENGIFRDVLLYRYGDTYLWDYEAIAHKTGRTYKLSLAADVKGADDKTRVRYILKDGRKTLASATVAAAGGAKADFTGLKVEEWSAEIPRLYELTVTVLQGRGEVMTVRKAVGFKDVKIKGTTFFFNGQKIKFKGVNHHDTHETRGYAMRFEDLEKDVKLMKEFNVNAVRTSHYPPDPTFLELCDRYGLYVVDEADIETHGIWDLGCEGGALSHNAKWIPRYTDRVRRMYYRDRSHVSITMWSLGNESHGYKCQDACYKMLKEIGTDLPVHYEGVCRTRRQHYDVYSEMYTHPDDLAKIRDRKRSKYHNEVPFFLCEYCHAMGVGPGALEDYMELFNSDDIFMGGCIWEWADHSVRDDKAKYRYTYGGDHGEKLHDGCFCVDGLMYPDRTPHTGALEMKAAYRPLRVRSLIGNRLTVFNTNYFRPSDGIELYWELTADGEVAACGSVLTAIAPRKAAAFTLDLPKPDKTKNCYLNVVYLCGDFEIAREQLALSEPGFIQPPLGMGKIDVVSDGDTLTVKYEGGAAVFCEKTGDLISYRANGVSVLNPHPAEHSGLHLNFARAWTDNDTGYKSGHWDKHNLASPQIVLEDIGAAVSGGTATVSKFLTVYGKEDALFTAFVLYLFGADGTMDVEVSVSPAPGSKETCFDLPLLGLTFEADRRFDTVTYFGRGPRENLPDFNLQAPVGLYSAAVKDENEPYVRPQDNGNHSDCRWLTLTDAKGDAVIIGSDRKFTFNVHNYTQKLLTAARHREDLHDEKTTYVTLDGYVRGIGTASCGPDTLPPYRFDASQELTFNFVFVPYKRGE